MNDEAPDHPPAEGSKPAARENAPTGTRRPGALERSTPDDVGSAPTSARSGQRHRRLVVGLGIVVAVLLPLTVLFAVLWVNASDDDDEDLDTIRRAAGDFASDFLTLDSAETDEWKERVSSHATGAFRRTFREGVETGIVQSLLGPANTRIESAVDEIYVGDVADRTAHVIVQASVISTTVDAEGEERRRPVEFFLELDLVSQEGEWLVDALANLNFGSGGSVPVVEEPPGEGTDDSAGDGSDGAEGS